MEEITIIDFIGTFAIIFLIIIIFMICAAGTAIVIACILKITEKIMTAIKNFFDNL